MRSALEEIIRSPLLPSYLDEIRHTLAAESARREFFYETMTEERRMEFINGEIIMHSPARDRHSATVLYLASLLVAHVTAHQLGHVVFEKALIVLPRNDYEPDVVFFGPEKAAQITPDTMKYPAPDFISEVLSPSTEDRDRGVKFEDYAANGVGEYWIVDLTGKAIEKYLLMEGIYILEGKYGIAERIVSQVVPGFEIPVRAIFNDQEYLASLRRILAE
jgi:Uma2 family endonuclease